ncbi:MAG TPA: sugar ABC transporter permease [Candidatus Limnocylindrales bacterium]|nr:sugar ABC transporter permease [Candidatus Limnocylindrales bacterium]
MAPAAALVALFTIYPLAFAAWSSLNVSSPLRPPAFVGLRNYGEIASSGYFLAAWSVTASFTLVTVVLTTLGALGAASILREAFLGGRLLRPLTLLPWAVPLVITGVIWRWIFNPQWGALNAMLYSAGIIRGYIPWLSDPVLAFAATCVAHTWSQLPLATIFLLGALQSIPREEYEAAAIDGANAVQRFRAITLPNIRTVLVIVVLYETLMGITAYDITYSMTAGGPGTATSLISYFTWSEGFKQLNFGRGAALAVIIAGVAFVFIAALLRLLPRGALSEDRT